MGGKGIKSFEELEPNKLVQDLVSFIDEKLPEFTQSDEFVDILAKKKNENQHSLAFCVYMTNECNSIFCFQRENAQISSSTVDIGVYRGSKLFFTIEAKILPTPNGYKRKEHEYVYGDGAGIQRFKDNKHGVDNEGNLLPINGLIAYCKENSFEHWQEKVNDWISDANWDESEKLEMVDLNTVAKLKSRHDRPPDAKVSLFHFWVYVSQK